MKMQNKNNSVLLFLMLILSMAGIGQQSTAIIKDVDGNTYETVQIGNQTWMAENLRTTRYNSGLPIEYPGYDDESWKSNSTGAYAWHNNDSISNFSFGALYNLAAVNHPDGLCPEGWRMPSKEVWNTLVIHLGGNQVAGGKMKEITTENWTGILHHTIHSRSCACSQAPSGPINEGATNESNFSGLPAGDRGSSGSFNGMNFYGAWWELSNAEAKGGWVYSLGFDRINISRTYHGSAYGFSVRCVKD